jgi:hypothetical protein
MKNIFFASIAALTLLVMNGCSVDGIDQDPNRPTQVTPDLLQHKSKTLGW